MWWDPSGSCYPSGQAVTRGTSGEGGILPLRRLRVQAGLWVSSSLPQAQTRGLLCQPDSEIRGWQWRPLLSLSSALPLPHPKVAHDLWWYFVPASGLQRQALSQGAVGKALPSALRVPCGILDVQAGRPYCQHQAE